MTNTTTTKLYTQVTAPAMPQTDYYRTEYRKSEETAAVAIPLKLDPAKIAAAQAQADSIRNSFSA